MEVEAIVLSLALPVIILIFLKYVITPPYHDSVMTDPDGHGYILENRVSHARFLPEQTAHRFEYPTISLLLSLKVLESGSLDLWNHRLFGYGGVHGRITGMRAQGYLFNPSDGRDKRTIKEKLAEILVARGHQPDDFHDAWIMTMPSYLGLQGINPLTVYFCYNEQGRPFAVVLEIHNTFGERHVHVLEPGVNEDCQTIINYDHKWTFPRQFHVSPFNDRSGFYSAAVSLPSHPPGKAAITLTPPRVQISLLTADASPRLKLVASIRPTRYLPFTATNWLNTLLRFPVILLLTMPRILYQAAILHYSKRLNVFAKPEPVAPRQVEEKLGVARNPIQPHVGDETAGSIGWQGESALEAWSKRIVLRFLQQRSTELGCRITLHSANVFEAKWESSSETGTEGEDSHLQIWYRSPRFFTLPVLCPTAELTLLMGEQGDRLFSTSSREHFLRVFSPQMNAIPTAGRLMRSVQKMRCSLIPPSVKDQRTGMEHHPLEHCCSSYASAASLAMLTHLLVLQDKLERGLYKLAGARFVRGDAPWEVWDRAQARHPSMRSPDDHRVGSEHEP